MHFNTPFGKRFWYFCGILGYASICLAILGFAVVAIDKISYRWNELKNRIEDYMVWRKEMKEV